MTAMKTEDQKTIRPPTTTRAGVIFMFMRLCASSIRDRRKRLAAPQGHDEIVQTDECRGDDEQAQRRAQGHVHGDLRQDPVDDLSIQPCGTLDEPRRRQDRRRNR